MQETTDKLRGSSTVLDDANRRIEETLEVGVGVVSELDRNRETLNRVRGNAGEVGGQLDVARRILRGASPSLFARAARLFARAAMRCSRSHRLAHPRFLSAFLRRHEQEGTP